jgi:hypothetical protein
MKPLFLNSRKVVLSASQDGFKDGLTKPMLITISRPCKLTPIKKDVKAVIVHVTEAPSITVLGNRIVCHRLSGTVVDEVKTADDITTVNVKASPWDERTAQAAWDASKAAPAATTAPVDPPKEKT